MSNKLQPKDIVKYIPHGLQIEILNYKCDYVGIRYGKANGYYLYNNELAITYDGGGTGKTPDTFKPILLPISCLTQEITFRGKGIVPLLELAKIAFPTQELFPFKITENREVHNDNGYLFWYSEIGQSFFARFENRLIGVAYQLSLFELLNSMLIDYAGLIDAGLAVSAFDINNPYI